MNMYQHEDDPKDEAKQEECCGNCKFYIRKWCHRFPPQLVQESGGWYQPRVDNEDWCGEWKSDE